jgi:hypothetical protein
MPICKNCADAADNPPTHGVTHCPACDRHIVAYPVSYLNIDRESEDDPEDVTVHEIVYHKHTLADGSKERCPGVGQPAVFKPVRTGHDLCNGCPCAHQAKGSWKGKQ